MATIEKLGKGSYEVRWDERDADGKRHQRRKRFDRQGEAADFVKALDADKPYEASRTVFNAWLDSWFEDYKPRLEVSTMLSYQHIVDICKAHFGAKPLDKVTPSMVEKFYTLLASPEHPLSKNPLTSSSVQRYHALLHRAFVFALRDGLIRFNPCDRVDRPKSSRQEPVIPAEEQVQERFDALAGTVVYLPCAISLVTGMRQSEVLGLKWSAVDLDHDKIAVRCVRQRLGKKRLEKVTLNASTRLVPEAPGCIERDHTKAKKNHALYIDPELTALLRATKRTQMENRLRFGAAYTVTDYVCTSEDGRPVDASAVAKAMAGVCRYHDLRHINAIQLLKAGHSVATVADRLGHTTPQTTLNFYAHSLDDQDRAAAQTMTSIFHLKT